MYTIYAMAWSPDGNYLAACGDNNQILGIDHQTKRPPDQKQTPVLTNRQMESIIRQNRT